MASATSVTYLKPCELKQRWWQLLQRIVRHAQVLLQSNGHENKSAHVGSRNNSLAITLHLIRRRRSTIHVTNEPRTDYAEVRMHVVQNGTPDGNPTQDSAATRTSFFREPMLIGSWLRKLPFMWSERRSFSRQMAGCSTGMEADRCVSVSRALQRLHAVGVLLFKFEPFGLLV